LAIRDLGVLRDGPDRVGIDLVDRAAGWTGVAVLDLAAVGDRWVGIDRGDDWWCCAFQRLSEDWGDEVKDFTNTPLWAYIARFSAKLSRES
jgi:hypothetical protein